MNFCYPVKGRCSLRRTQHLGCYKLGLADQLLNSHRHMFFLIDLLESLDIFRTRVNHHKFYSSHVCLLFSLMVTLHFFITLLPEIKNAYQYPADFSVGFRLMNVEALILHNVACGGGERERR